MIYMEKELIRSFLNRQFSAGVYTRTTQFLTRRGVSEQVLNFCLDNRLLLLQDNQGVWVYQITDKGEKFRDRLIDNY